MVQSRSRILSFLVLVSSSLLAQQAVGPEQNITGEWALSGYLESGQRAYVTIQDRKIKAVSVEKPVLAAEKILESEDWIAPGFIDLHNHLSYSVVPLWENALGQFDNRFEWRDQKVKAVVKYDEATSLQMQPFNPRPKTLSLEQKLLAERALCAAIRWAEVKALVGGATLTQGYMGESLNIETNQGSRTRLSCAASYLLPNVEIQSDLPEMPSVMSKTDLVDDLAAWGVNEPYLYPLMERENISYAEATQKFLEQEGLFSWLSDFNAFDRSVASGLKLALGKDLPAWEWLTLFADPANIPERRELEAKREDIYNFFVDVKGYRPDSVDRPNNVDRSVNSVISWIYGPQRDDGSGFIHSKPQEGAQRNAFEQLGRGGVHRLRFIVIEYAVDFYNRIYLPLMREKQNPKFRLIAHLSEGRKSHAFTRREFKDVVRMDLAFEKSIFIHGVGLDEDDLDSAKSKDITFVWSPLSNLLLYQDTLDVPQFLKKNINLALGPDWSATGSKSVLFELKAARALFDKWIAQGKLSSFSNKELVALATVNPAKALSMEDHLGQVKENFYANLLLVRKQSENMYNDILNSDEDDLKLIVVGGLPRSGVSAWMQQLLPTKLADLEDLANFSSNKCIQDKVFFARDPNELDQELETLQLPLLDSLATISKTVHEARQRQRDAATPAVRAKLKDIDPIFDCDSPSARLRLNEVIASALPATPDTLNEQERKRLEIRLRADQPLGEEWKSKFKSH